MNTIKYIPEIDFIHFCDAAANIEEMKSKMERELKTKTHIVNKELIKKNEEYFKEASEYMEQLSFIQKNTFNLFFHRTSVLSDFLIYLTYGDCGFEKITIDSFKDFITKMTETEIDELPSTFNEVYSIVKDHYDSPDNFEDFNKTSSLIMDIIKEPKILEESFKSAVLNLYQDFIEKKVIPKKDEIDNILKRHQALMDKDPKQFIPNLTKGKLNPNEVNTEEMQGVLSVYSPFALYISITHKKFIYGLSLEELRAEENETEFFLALLKFLSDPKRYQMIQMLSKKKWYSNELAKKFNITPATMSYHVNKLYALGLIHFEQGEQNKLYIELDNDRLAYLMKKMQNDLLK
ncbi:MAG: winged helix-turn-helix transcriptional regulator [Clostridiales bacterium]|nr:winged helix-turn-helix transcriptional regulator [Clostridiales bacterium]